MRRSIFVASLMIVAACGGGSGAPAPGSGGSGGHAPAPGSGGTAGHAPMPGSGGIAGQAPNPGSGGTAGQAPTPGSGGAAGRAPTPGSGGAAGQAPSPGSGGSVGSGGQAPTPGTGGAGGQGLPLGRCFVGNSAAAPELTLVYRTTAGLLSPIASLTSVPLTQPPQGGEALFIGVRARNIDGCPIMMSTALLAPDSDVVVAFERRPVNLEAAGDGWLQPSQPTAFSNFSNLPSCPKAGLGRRIDGQQYRLQVIVDDPEGRHAEITVLIVPSCGQPTPSATCQCLCSATYVLGSVCP